MPEGKRKEAAMSLGFFLKCDKCGDSKSFNATHNLIPMWRAAGVAEALYDSEGKLAGDIVPALKAGVADMKAEPQKFEAINLNGWGDYDSALAFLERVLADCEAHPHLVIDIWK